MVLIIVWGYSQWLVDKHTHILFMQVLVIGGSIISDKLRLVISMSYDVSRCHASMKRGRLTPWANSTLIFRFAIIFCIACNCLSVLFALTKLIFVLGSYKRLLASAFLKDELRKFRFVICSFDHALLTNWSTYWSTKRLNFDLFVPVIRVDSLYYVIRSILETIITS